MEKQYYLFMFCQSGSRGTNTPVQRGAAGTRAELLSRLALCPSPQDLHSSTGSTGRVGKAGGSQCSHNYAGPAGTLRGSLPALTASAARLAAARGAATYQSHRIAPQFNANEQHFSCLYTFCANVFERLPVARQNAVFGERRRVCVCVWI